MKCKLLPSLLLLFLCYDGIAQTNTRDSLALVDLYNSTSGPNWKSHTNWLTAQPVSSWYGIIVRNNRVVSIILGYNRLSGNLPSSIGNLDSLQTLSITNNYTSLTGSIPSSIGNLHHVSLLDLNTNGFTGSIPYSVGTIDSLQTLNLSNNSLSGNIPLSVSKLKKLQSFDASYNKAGLGHISGNGISGSIPDSLGFCTNLVTLNLGYNSLTGSLPSSFQYLAKLSRLEIFNNQLSGLLTNVFNTNSQLAYLNLSSNQFSGNVPAFFNQLTKLTTLLLSTNQFSGIIPTQLSEATSLVILDLSSNQLTGKIPASFNNLPSLISLNLSSNKLSGQLPYLFRNYTLPNPNLNVSNNSFTISQNPQWNGAQQPGTFNFSNNKFMFSGLEYFTEKYYIVNNAQQAQIKIKQQGNKLTVNAGGTLRKNIYYWYSVGDPDATIIKGNSSYQPAVSGSYYVYVTNKTVTDLTLMSDTIVYNAPPTGNNTQPAISFYPNPVKAFITITGLKENADAKVTVTDMNGQVWLTTMSRKRTMIQMETASVKPGTYLVSINDGKDIKTLSFIKE